MIFGVSPCNLVCGYRLFCWKWRQCFHAKRWYSPTTAQYHNL